MILDQAIKVVAVKLNENLTGRLDTLAKNGGMTRGHLMLCLINIWLHALEKSSLPHMFYVANLLRVHKSQMIGDADVYEHEFSGSRIPETAIPIKLTETDIFNISCHANKSHISRHQMLKTMVIVGIEELESITAYKPYEYREIESPLHTQLSKIMEGGYKAFKAYLK